MGKNYQQRKEYAVRDIDRWVGQHVIKEEPVRSFRFHGHYTDKKYTKGNKTMRPGFIVFSPGEGASFAYTSTYCFTLTWTPGHMTIVGDLGELTVVHYNAMPTLQEACKWLLTPDFHYLLSKTAVRREYDREQTIDDLWRDMMEPMAEHLAETQKEITAYEADPPKWRKRDGMTKVEFEREKQSYAEDHPRIVYGFRERKRPLHSNRNLWSDADEIGYDIPYGLERLARCWHFFRERYDVDHDPNGLFDAAGQNQLKAAIDSYCYERSDDEVASWVYRDLGYEDYSGVYEYPERAFTQIAAIQFGCRMILAQTSQKVAA